MNVQYPRDLLVEQIRVLVSVGDDRAEQTGSQNVLAERVLVHLMQGLVVE